MSDQEHQHRENGGNGAFVPLESLAPVHELGSGARAAKTRLQGAHGRQYWRSLEELAGTPEFQQYLEKEFPLQAPRDMSPLSRREFFRVMGATLALAGVGGCAYQPPEKIIPYVEQPEVLVPGKPLYYSSAFTRGGYAIGVLGETHMGRPIKLEGNPDHPASLGATDIHTQASLLHLYDPDRSQAVRLFGGASTWEAFQATISDAVPSLRRSAGAGLRIVIPASTSPTLTWQLRRVLQRYPQARVHVHEPAGRENVHEGTRLAFGQELNPVYHFNRARRILSLDSNFLQDEPGSVRYAREFMDGRRTHTVGTVAGAKGGQHPTQKGAAAPAPGQPPAGAAHGAEAPAAGAPAPGAHGGAAGTAPGGAAAGAGHGTDAGHAAGAGGHGAAPAPEMNRLYCVESMPTITGATADHRLGLTPTQIEAFARAVAAAVGAPGAGGASLPAGVPQEWLNAVVQDLQGARGASLVVAGPYASPELHAIAFAINQALGNIGTTVTFTAPVEARFGDRTPGLSELVEDLKSNRVKLLLFLGGNPVYTAPADLGLVDALQKATLRVHLGLYDDETGAQCHWHLPESHYLEAWSDARAFDGTATIIQPLIRPFYGTRSAHEVLAMLLEEGDRSGYDIVREHWMTQGPVKVPVPAGAGGQPVPNGLVRTEAPATTPAFERFWHAALEKGTIPNAATPARTAAARGVPAPPPAAPAGGGGLELILRPDPHIWDGSFANNPWLQELPKPLNLLTWDNAALISAGTARQLGLVGDTNDFERLVAARGQMLELTYQGRKLKAPVWIQPGHPDNAVTLTLGYGRTRAGKVGNGTGFNAYALRTAASPWGGPGLEARKSGESYPLVSAQQHFTMEGRELVKVGLAEEYAQNPAHPHFMAAEGHGGGGEGGEGKETTESHEGGGEPPSLYRQMWPSDREGADDAKRNPGTWSMKGWGRAYDGREVPAWGMVIDLNTCIGCNACTIACQAENNIPTVGKDQVANAREMHWIRVDNYFTGDFNNPEAVFQPVPCMHCEKAPCEPVCPVEATSHSAEGINEMTYNRCIGTRYCSNNCPYKVRRFNFLQYSDQDTPTIQMMKNPDVTVRSRGVMEKCTYCVQRINQARMEAEKEERAIRDGDVLTACQQVCPTQAIVFGNLNDRERQGSRVRQLRQHPLNYTLLTELNTRPRTSYMARLRNPHPSLANLTTAGASGHEGKGH